MLREGRVSPAVPTPDRAQRAHGGVAGRVDMAVTVPTPRVKEWHYRRSYTSVCNRPPEKEE